MRLLRTLTKKNIQGKTCLVRLNLDIKNPQKNSLRIQSAIPTLKHIITCGGKPIIISHRGRPHGINASLSLKPAIIILEKALGVQLEWRENLRFDPREIENDMAFAKEIAKGADIYINDDFATSHRATASLVAITHVLPAYAGLNLEQEIINLSKARNNPDYPRVVLLGGIKLEDKLGVIQKLENAETHFLLGSAYNLPRAALPRHAHIVLPEDGIGEKTKWFDIGPHTIQKYTDILTRAKTVIWSGPVGLTEDERYTKGSLALARAIIKSKAFSIVGGGDTADFLQKEKLLTKFSWTSTGGGAMLAFLAGEHMRAITALE